MKALVGAFNQEKALVGAFSVIVQPVVEPMDRFAALYKMLCSSSKEETVAPQQDDGLHSRAGPQLVRTMQTGR